MYDEDEDDTCDEDDGVSWFWDTVCRLLAAKCILFISLIALRLGSHGFFGVHTTLPLWHTQCVHAPSFSDILMVSLFLYRRSSYRHPASYQMHAFQYLHISQHYKVNIDMWRHRVMTAIKKNCIRHEQTGLCFINGQIINWQRNSWVHYVHQLTVHHKQTCLGGGVNSKCKAPGLFASQYW